MRYQNRCREREIRSARSKARSHARIWRTQRLPRLVGKGRALKLILSGDIIDAAEAYRIGLVDELVPDAHVIERAETVLKKIIANAP